MTAKRAPLVMDFLLAWAAYSVFVTAAIVIWGQAAPGAQSREMPEFRDYLDLFLNTAARSIAGIAMFSVYFLAIRGVIRGMTANARAIINWFAFLMLTSLGQLALLVMLEGHPMRALAFDLVPILLSASLAMLLLPGLRQRLFAMTPTS